MNMLNQDRRNEKKLRNRPINIVTMATLPRIARIPSHLQNGRVPTLTDGYGIYRHLRREDGISLEELQRIEDRAARADEREE